MNGFLLGTCKDYDLIISKVTGHCDSGEFDQSLDKEEQDVMSVSVILIFWYFISALKLPQDI